MNYQRANYESFQERSKSLSDFNKKINTPEGYGNEVYRQLKAMGYSNAKELCLKNSNFIFNSFLMGEPVSNTKLEIVK